MERTSEGNLPEQFEIEGFKGRSKESPETEGYYLVFPGGDMVFFNKKDVQHPVVGEMPPQVTGDKAFQRFVRDYQESSLPNTPKAFKTALNSYVDKETRGVHRTEKTYRFLYEGKRGGREVFKLTTDKSDIRL
ncbi:MAG: hypothetical protein IIA85_00785 [Nanoarchaeota archaeon]|nr:hypothetical protein [Nanoarchaeota archaeon]